MSLPNGGESAARRYTVAAKPETRSPRKVAAAVSWDIHSPARVDGSVRSLLAEAQRADGVPPLSDGVLDAADAADTTTVALVDGSTVVGFGIATGLGSRGAVEFTIHPDFRGQGLGKKLWTELLERLRAEGSQHTTWPWSHGNHPAAAALAAEYGYTPQRTLLQLQTPRVEKLELPPLDLPAGVSLRTFETADEERWREINNAAFSWHPEQGNQTIEDIRGRTRSADFDPRDVIIAEQDGRVIGFHDTKMHPEHVSGLLVGEVYVIAVDPSVHAKGIGNALMVAGMRDMIDRRGAQMLELYVEDDNDKALGLYDRLGFAHRIEHISYAPPQAEDTAETTQGER